MRSSSFVLAVLPLLTFGVACSSSSTQDNKTTDGGTTSSGEGGTPTPTPVPPPVGWRAAVGASGLLVQTFDEKTWESRTVASHDLYGVACVGNLLGWAVGPAGAVAHTTDGGRTWAAETSHLTATLRAVRFGDASFGVIAGDGGALATTHDGGATWSPAAAGTTLALRGVAVAGSLALAVGDGGTLVRSDDAGATFAATTIAGATDLQGVAADADAHLVLAVDTAGAIWASTDRAVTFHREGTATRALHAVSLHPRGLTALAAGDDGVALERAGDGTWSTVATSTHATLRAALVTDSGTSVYLAGDQGTLLGRAAGLGFTAIPTGSQAALYGLEDL